MHLNYYSYTLIYYFNLLIFISKVIRNLDKLHFFCNAKTKYLRGSGKIRMGLDLSCSVYNFESFSLTAAYRHIDITSVAASKLLHGFYCSRRSLDVLRKASSSARDANIQLIA